MDLNLKESLRNEGWFEECHDTKLIIRLWREFKPSLPGIITFDLDFRHFEYTHGDKKLHTLLVKYFNDLLDGQKSERSIDKVTYFYVGDLFCIHLGTNYANFQEKIFADISGRKLQTLYSSNANLEPRCIQKRSPT